MPFTSHAVRDPVEEPEWVPDASDLAALWLDKELHREPSALEQMWEDNRWAAAA